MGRFFAETRKAWAAAATVFGAGFAEAQPGGVTGDEFTAVAVAAAVAWVVTWAIPNRDGATGDR